MTRIKFIRVLISLAAIQNLTVHKKDVKTDFLNGELEEEIYMEHPKSFVTPGQENNVCKCSPVFLVNNMGWFGLLRAGPNQRS